MDKASSKLFPPSRFFKLTHSDGQERANESVRAKVIEQWDSQYPTMWELAGG
jgi:hypothetical protein